MSLPKFSLNLNNLKDFNIDKYEKNFTFIVNSKCYKTNRFIADLLSPTIRKNHYNDPSDNEFIINMTINNNNNNKNQAVKGSSSEDYFSDFVQLSTFNEVEVDYERLDLYAQYFLQLGNISEYLSIQEIRMKDAKEDFFIETLIDLSKIEQTLQITIDKGHEKFIECIQNVSENFSNISKDEIKKIDVGFLEEIIKNDHFQIGEEDELFEFIEELYEEDRMYGFLFEYVIFNNLSEKNMYKFIESFCYEDMNFQIWRTICARLAPSFFKQERRYKKEKSNKEGIKQFKYEQGKELDGIMKYLTNETGGNIHDKGIIEITSNDINGIYHPKNLVDYSNDSFYDHHSQFKGAFVCFDFKEKLVQLTNYTIRSSTCRFLKNWNLEVSENGKTWKIVDCHENDSSLKGINKTATFKIKPEENNFYRFIRIRETGCRWDRDDCYDADYTMVEFFGKLKQTTK